MTRSPFDVPSPSSSSAKSDSRQCMGFEETVGNLKLRQQRGKSLSRFASKRLMAQLSELLNA